jgi:hypothetical protein
MNPYLEIPIGIGLLILGIISIYGRRRHAEDKLNVDAFWWSEKVARFWMPKEWMLAYDRFSFVWAGILFIAMGTLIILDALTVLY